MKEEYREIKGVEFNQATKKDAYKVTEGKYTMSTTKKGRYIHRSTPYDVQLKKLWRVGPESSRLTVQYRMGHTLKDMGLELKPIDWSRVIVRRRSSSGSGSTSPPTTPPVSPGQKESSRDDRSSSPKNATESEDCRKDSDSAIHGESSQPSDASSSSTSCTDIADSTVSDKVESRELKVDYLTTKIKEEPKDISQSITHIQIIATS